VRFQSQDAQSVNPLVLQSFLQHGLRVISLQEAPRNLEQCICKQLRNKFRESQGLRRCIKTGGPGLDPAEGSGVIAVEQVSVGDKASIPVGRWWDELRLALVITRREIRDQFRDWRIIIPMVTLTLIFPG